MCLRFCCYSVGQYDSEWETAIDRRPSGVQQLPGTRLVTSVERLAIVTEDKDHTDSFAIYMALPLLG
jgi:hypothetical protein